MAHVATPTLVQERIDRHLSYLTAVLDGLPEIAAEWDNWTDLQQLDFVVEWPLKQGRLNMLAEWKADGLLDVDQDLRYRALLSRLADARPILDRLLAD